jgi:ribulose-5-phosphate 4-epimerase/fuculose-1-phosphate aldolase
MGIVTLATVRTVVSAEEWQARVNLAACYRLVHRYKMTDNIYNHITLRIPGTNDVLINPFGLRYDEITASSLIRIDLDGNIIHKPDLPYGINPAGFIIHSTVHAAREDAHCVIHTHTRAGTALGCTEAGLLPLSQTALLLGEVAHHDFEGPAMDEEERVRLAASLGNARAIVLRNHGLLTCAPTVGEAFYRLVMLERACQIQLDAMAAGPVRLCSPEAISYTRNLLARGQQNFGLDWAAWLRELDRYDPDYVN